MDIMRKIGRLIGSNSMNTSTNIGENKNIGDNTRTEVERRASQDHEGKGRKWKGTALFVDYGADHFFSNSLRVRIRTFTLPPDFFHVADARFYAH
jgi:hypothetical protein